MFNTCLWLPADVTQLVTGAVLCPRAAAAWEETLCPSAALTSGVVKNASVL